MQLLNHLETLGITFVTLAGGAWALFQFIISQRQEAVRRQSVVQLSLDISEARLPDDDRLFLAVNVGMHNAGDRNTAVHYTSDDHLTLTPCTANDDGTLNRGTPIKRNLMRGDTRVATNTLLAGQQNTLPFFVAIPGPGLYHVRFYVEPQGEQLDLIRKAGGLGRGVNAVVISTNQYFVAKGSQE